MNIKKLVNITIECIQFWHKQHPIHIDKHEVSTYTWKLYNIMLWTYFYAKNCEVEQTFTLDFL